MPGGCLSSSFVITDLIGTSVFLFLWMPVETKRLDRTNEPAKPKA
jgi:hypothetical protein